MSDRGAGGPSGAGRPGAAQATFESMLRLGQIIETFRMIEPEIPSQVIAVFALIAQRGEMQTREIGLATGLSPAAANRAVATLSDQHWIKAKPGLRLIEVRVDPEDRRQRRVRLGARGHHLAHRIDAILNPPPCPGAPNDIPAAPAAERQREAEET